VTAGYGQKQFKVGAAAKSPRRDASYAAVGTFFAAVGARMCQMGLHAILTHTHLAGGPDTPAISGWEATFLGLCGISISACAIWSYFQGGKRA
jgi:hypothetical protein